MELIYSDIELENKLIEECLGELFPGLVFFNWDLTSEPPSGFDFENKNHCFYNGFFDPEKIEFGFCLTIERMPGEYSQAREIHIIRNLEKKIDTRFLMGYENPEHPGNPYYSLIFECGEIFLSDDSNTNFADGETGLVKKVRPVSFPITHFSPRGELVIPQHEIPD